MERDPIAVVGGGAWGSALAVHLADLGHPVGMWVREAEVVRGIRDRRENETYLPGVRFPPGVEAHAELPAALDGATLVVAVVPSLFARRVYREMGPVLEGGCPVVVATKGIEEETLALPLQVAADELGEGRPLAVLSGPSFAAELAGRKPTAVVVASERQALAREVQGALSSPVLRLYTNDDVTGVQLAGATKNVIAIAAGVADSLGMGLNAQAALITRGLAEIGRLGRRLGGRARTFAGLAGMGDLVLTCTGSLSRNRRVGQRIGRGEDLARIEQEMCSVAEGVRTTRSVRELAAGNGVEMPIVEEVHRMIFEGGSPRKALSRLMGRPLTSEEDAAEVTPRG